MGGLAERANAGFVAQDAGAGDAPAIPIGGDDGEAVPPSLADNTVPGAE